MKKVVNNVKKRVVTMEDFFIAMRQNKLLHSLTRVNDLTMLYPPFRAKVVALLKDMKLMGLNPVVSETYRSDELQLIYFNSKPPRTKLKSGSMHHFYIAVDIYPRDLHGNLVNDNTPEGKMLWQEMGNAVRRQGLYWGGDFSTFQDKPHVQMIPATKDAQAKIKKGIYPTA